MVAESINIDNKLTENFYRPIIKTIKMLHIQKEVYCSKNSQSTTKVTLSSIATNKSFSVLHQNIAGLRGKNNELLGSVLPELPHIICLTEHHLK